MKDSKLVGYSIVFIALVVLAIVLQTFESVLRPLAIAILLTFLMVPLAKFSKKKKVPVWLTFSALFIIIVLSLGIFSSLINVESAALSDAIPRFQQYIQDNSGEIEAFGSKFGLDMDMLTPEKLSTFFTAVASKVLALARAIFSEILLVLILLIFVFQSRISLAKYIQQKYGKEEEARLETTFEKIESDIIAYFGTKTFVSLCTAIGSGVVLFLFSAKFISLSILLIFSLNFIPVLGSIVAVVILLTLYGLTFGFSATLVWLFLCLLAIQFFFGNFLEPKLAGEKLRMSPILIILSLYIWGWVWGIIGMLLSVPLTIMILITFKHLKKMGALT